MKFAPFTGIDNHKKSITFGCALLDHEDDNAFIWAFQQFLKAMGGKEPHYIISNQDPRIINAVQAVFKKARHRFCMWHLMKKLTDKVGSTICKETDFLSRLNNVVWSADLELEEFEENWAKVISDFSLEGNKWLTGKFAEREKWIPAYFRNLLEAESENSMPETLFGSNWEAHAVKVYTHEVFFDFQQEVKFSVNACSVCGYTPPDLVTNFEIQLLRTQTSERDMQLSTIGEQWIWSKNALRNPVYDLNGNLLENFNLTGNSSKFGMSRVWSEIYATVSMLKRKEEESDIREFAKLIKEFREKLEPNPKPLTKEQELELLLNCKAPKEVKILPPKVSKNKGSGKRLVSIKNKAIMKAKKPKRMCAKCKCMSHHDKRNCPNEFAEHPPENQYLIKV
ncbi:protein FAR-RED IMPAIRED RESPONSE 1-like [Silene latifolia]|uniref:protein FAR-RED IMPAIRED RESPONSE 1-like n=1 Tax=Silene latifolia TaxID=37657 RepID=UPI003D77E068